jgi:dephospho-CoA kinase
MLPTWMERSFLERERDAVTKLAINDINLAKMLFNSECCYCKKIEKGCNMNAEKIVISLAGMPGSGKSLVVATAYAEGYAVVVMGDVVREETRRRGLELNPKNIGRVMLELRKEGGASVIADKCISKIEQQESEKVIVDGVRSLSEVESFKKRFPNFSLIAVHASPETRFKRLYNRRRSDDPDGWEVFHERDMRELGVGLGDAIAMAEYLIINENSKANAKAAAKNFIGRIERKWMK